MFFLHLLCCSGFISSDRQARNQHDDLPLRGFESGGKLGFSAIVNVIESTQNWPDSVDFVLVLGCRLFDQRSPLCHSDPLLFPLISVSASCALSASMLRRICDGAIYVAILQRSQFFAVQPASHLAPLLYAPATLRCG